MISSRVRRIPRLTKAPLQALKTGPAASLRTMQSFGRLDRGLAKEKTLEDSPDDDLRLWKYLDRLDGMLGKRFVEEEEWTKEVGESALRKVSSALLSVDDDGLVDGWTWEVSLTNDCEASDGDITLIVENEQSTVLIDDERKADLGAFSYALAFEIDREYQDMMKRVADYNSHLMLTKKHVYVFKRKRDESRMVSDTLRNMPQNTSIESMMCVLKLAGIPEPVNQNQRFDNFTKFDS